MITPHFARGGSGSHLSITAICISRTPETFDLQSLPFYNYTAGWKPFQHERIKERVAYLAERRNAAVALALSEFPRTDHILMIDSYYLHQDRQINGLIDEYSKMTLSEYPEGCILGASTWILDKTRVRSRLRFYDWWTTPEASSLKLSEVERIGGTISAKAVGGCYLYPRWVWERIRYDVPDDLHGCEHNWLCEHSGLPVFLSLTERLWRDPIVYSLSKRVRMSLHLRRLLGQ
jgi:hypothetical protein